MDGFSTGVISNDYAAASAGAYFCRIYTACDTVDSDTINLTVLNSPSVSITPSPIAYYCPNDSVALEVNSGGNAAIQWYMDGIMIAGATNATYYASAEGNYNVTKTNANNCTDSAAMATQVIMSMPTTSTLIDTACGSYTVPSGNMTYTMSGMYMDTIPNATGCDSIITIDLTILNAPTTTITPSPTAFYCSGDSVELTVNSNGNSLVQWYMDGMMIAGATNVTYFASAEGSYNVTKTNNNGCTDSAAVATQVMMTVISNTTTVSGDTIMADLAGATYQWLDCNNGNMPIAGETNQSFVASVSGNYAVEITNGNCVDTSVCTALVVIGIQDAPLYQTVSVYPNPNTGAFTIDLQELNTDNTTIEIYTTEGKLIYTEMTNEQIHNVNLNVAAGLYIVKVYTGEVVTVQPLVVE